MFEQDMHNPDPRHDPWPALEIVVQEILLSELLSRVWSATVLTHDWYHQTDELHGLVHSVHVSHIEAKNRALRILLSGQATNETAFDRINRVRRRLERWTDLFLGQLPRGDKAIIFGFDRQSRCKTSTRSSGIRRTGICHPPASADGFVRRDLIRDRTQFAANPELNREIAAGILACFPSDRFDSHGLPKSVQSIWIEKSQNDTQMLLDQLVGFEDTAERGPTCSVRRVFTRH